MNEAVEYVTMAMEKYDLAMAGQRILEGKEEKPLDGQILESVKQEPAYSKALDFLTYMLNQTDLEFPDTEKDFLTVHLCNLFMP